MESWVLMTDWPSISKSIQKSQSSNSSLNDLSIQNGKEILHERPTQWLFGRWISKISARPTSPHQKHEVRFNLNLVARRPVVRLCETETIRSILCPIFDDYMVVSKCFQDVLFSLGEMIHFDKYFSNGLVQPPTRMKIFSNIFEAPDSKLSKVTSSDFLGKHNKRPCNIEKTTWDFSGNHFQNHEKTWVLGLKIKDSLPSFPNKIPHQQKPTEFDPGLSPGVWSLQSVQASAERWRRGSMSCARFWSRSSWCLERQKTLKEETIWILKGQKS